MNQYKVWDRYEGKESRADIFEAESVERAAEQYADDYSEYCTEGCFNLFVRNIADGSIVCASVHPEWRCHETETPFGFELERLNK